MPEEPRPVCEFCQYPSEAGHAPDCSSLQSNKQESTPATEVEKNPEHPTRAEVIEQIEKIVGSDKYTIEREREDSEGLYLIETIVNEPDGGKAEYAYMRKGKYKEGSTAVTGIQVTYYDSDGMPFSGTTVTELINGQWVPHTGE